MTIRNIFSHRQHENIMEHRVPESRPLSLPFWAAWHGLATIFLLLLPASIKFGKPLWAVPGEHIPSILLTALAYLAGAGIPTSRMRAVSYGADPDRQVNPGAQGPGEVGWQNRRVAMVIDFSGAMGTPPLALQSGTGSSQD